MRDDNRPTGGAMLPMRADEVHTRFLLDDGKEKFSVFISPLSELQVCAERLSFWPPDGASGGKFWLWNLIWLRVWRQTVFKLTLLGFQWWSVWMRFWEEMPLLLIDAICWLLCHGSGETFLVDFFLRFAVLSLAAAAFNIFWCKFQRLAGVAV